MIRLKLFEDFEESSFYKIDATEWVNDVPNSIPLNKYTFKNMKQSLEKRLTRVFGHNDFFIDFYPYKVEYRSGVLDTIELIYIYERINTLAVYKIFLIEDEWFYITSENRGLVYTKPGFISYYKADDIRGIYDAIMYDYEISKQANLYCKLPARNNIYGSDGVKKQFFEAKGVLLDTYKDFPIAEFPKSDVEAIINNLKLPENIKFSELKIENNIGRIIMRWKTDDYDNTIKIDLYYIKETNRFICGDLLDWDYYACVGLKGLELFLIDFLKEFNI